MRSSDEQRQQNTPQGASVQEVVVKPQGTEQRGLSSSSAQIETLPCEGNTSLLERKYSLLSSILNFLRTAMAFAQERERTMRSCKRKSISRRDIAGQVDMDLEKFFDRVNHDILMSRVARKVEDKRVLKLIRAYLNAGVMENGIAVRTEEGTPQGGPLSPLLANILLDDFDRELAKRGHRFVRYADDCAPRRRGPFDMVLSYA